MASRGLEPAEERKRVRTGTAEVNPRGEPKGGSRATMARTCTRGAPCRGRGMDQRIVWTGLGLAVAGIATAGLLLWREEPRLDRELDRVLAERDGREVIGVPGALAAERRSNAAVEPAGAELLAAFRREVEAYEAARSGPEGEAEREHDRAMAVEGLAQQIDRPVAGAADAGDLLVVAARLEAWYGLETAADVRDCILDALAPQRSAITARVLWRALVDVAEEVRETARFHVEDILGDDAPEGGEARRSLVELARTAAADTSSPLREWAAEQLAACDGGGE